LHILPSLLVLFWVCTKKGIKEIAGMYFCHRQEANGNNVQRYIRTLEKAKI